MKALRNGIDRFRLPLFIFLPLLFLSTAAASKAEGSAVDQKDSAKNHISYYIATHEAASPDDSRVMRVHRIFRRVLAAADKRGTLHPHLRLFQNDDSPIARALPDGFIVLTTKVLDICFNGVDTDIGDARMAFVLGHELGHMADDDFWHQKIRKDLSSNPDLAGIREIITDSSDVSTEDMQKWTVHRQAKEVRADDCGFMYAAISGFRVDTLIGDDKHCEAFFSYWTSRTQPQEIDHSHPLPDDRTQFLKNRLRKLSRHIDFFKYGVRLAHFGHYDEAIYFFREFQNTFPSREVLNNIGYCRLQQAIEQMPATLAYHYWLPSALDLGTRADKIKLTGARGNSPQLSPDARALLNEAARYFRDAADRDKSHWPSFLNLAVANFYLKELFDARAAIEKARIIAPQNHQITITRALILNLQDPLVDMWREATRQLESVVSNAPTNLCALYNLAILHEDRGRGGKASRLWKALAAYLPRLPPPIRKAVIQKSGIPPTSSPAESEPTAIPWKLPLPLGTDLCGNKKAQKQLEAWTFLDFNWGRGNLKGRIWTSPDGNQLLEKDEFIEMVVLAGNPLMSVDDLERHFGPPHALRRCMAGDLLDYKDGITVVAIDGKTAEIWLERGKSRGLK